jgi:hypothetical protein
MEKDSFKLPKSWKHWLKHAGLRREYTGSKGEWTYYSFVGRGRHWRINRYGEFQCSEPYALFDRWANSLQETWQLPKTKNEFVSLVKNYNWLDV